MTIPQISDTNDLALADADVDVEVSTLENIQIDSISIQEFGSFADDEDSESDDAAINLPTVMTTNVPTEIDRQENFEFSEINAGISINDELSYDTSDSFDANEFLIRDGFEETEDEDEENDMSNDAENINSVSFFSHYYL